MTLKNRREDLIDFIEKNYNRLSEREIDEICCEIEAIDNYILECQLMNEM